MHAGSGNHGCEAIVNSLCHMLKAEGQAAPLVITNSVKEDEQYSLGKGAHSEEALCELVQERHFSQHKIAHVLYYIWRKLTKDGESFLRYRYGAVFDRPLSRYGKKRASGQGAEYPLAISIGGDNYCYDVMIKDLMLANKAFKDRGTKTVLLGCSIEPELILPEKRDGGTGAVYNRAEDADAGKGGRSTALREDLNRYDMIIARESLTYEALKQIVPEEKLRLIPDPAFTLGTKKLPLPEGFKEGETIGINLSPMIQDSEPREGITMENYSALLTHIIQTTDMQIALIPHVVWGRNDDRKPLRELYEAFRDTGRVVMIEDASCEELKGYIARCRMFIGARTHATIAAYSSLVPTLVVGYSVKAKGIAKDLFGTYDNYVIPVQQLREKSELIEAFEWLKDYEDAMRNDLCRVMPAYKERAMQAGKEVEKIWEESNTQPKI